MEAVISDEEERNEEKHLAMLRLEYQSARSALLAQIDKMCPSEHHAPVVHRDDKPSWCNACGRTKLGVLVGNGRVRK